ncbi:hypothetical protein Tco_0109700 [Tanacetum coccineum]
MSLSSTLLQDRGRREGKAPMTEEETQASRKTNKDQILQEEAGLDESYSMIGLLFEQSLKQCQNLKESLYYKFVMKKHGMNKPEDEFEKVLWEYLKNMFEEPLSTDSIWSLQSTRSSIKFEDNLKKLEVHNWEDQVGEVLGLSGLVYCLEWRSVGVVRVVGRGGWGFGLGDGVGAWKSVRGGGLVGGSCGEVGGRGGSGGRRSWGRKMVRGGDGAERLSGFVGRERRVRVMVKDSALINIGIQ